MKKLLIIFLLIGFGTLAENFPDSTISLLESQLSELPDTNPEKVFVLIRLIESYRNVSVDESLNYAGKAIELAKKLKLNEALSEAYRQKAKTYVLNGLSEQAWDNLNLALENDEINKLQASKALSYSEMAHLLLSVNDKVKATEYLAKSIELSGKSENKDLLARQYEVIGDIFLDVEDYDKGLEYYIKSLSINEDLNDTFQIAGIYSKLGNIYEKLHSYDKAISYYSQSYDLIKKTRFERFDFCPALNLGSLYQSQSNFELAMDYYNQALENYQSNENILGISVVYYKFGLIEQLRGEFALAEKNFLKALDYKHQIGDLKGSMQVYEALSELYKSQNQDLKAEAYLVKAAAIAERLHSIKEQYRILQKLQLLYLSAKNDAMTLKTSLQLCQLADSMLNNPLVASRTGLDKVLIEQNLKDRELDKINSLTESEKLKKQFESLNLVLISLGLFIIFGSVVFYFYRKRAKFQLESEKNKLLNLSLNQKLNRSEAMYKAVVDMTHDIIFIARQDKIEFANSRMIELSGYSDEEFKMCTLSDLIHPDDRAGFIKNLSEQIQNNRDSLHSEVQFISNDGRSHSMEIVTRLIKLDDNAVLLGSGRDLTERKEAEAKLHVSEQLYKNLVQNSPTGIIYIDTDGKIIEINKNALRIIGLSEDKLFDSLNFFEVFPDPESLIFKDIEHCIESREATHNEYLFKGFHLEERYINYYISPLFDGTGKINRIIINLEDISDKKKIELKLKISEQRQNLALENTRTALWDWDIENDKMIFNEIFYELLGYSPGEIKNSRNALDALMKPTDRNELRLRLENHLKGVTPMFKFEYQVLSKSGRWRWISDQGKVVQTDNSDRPARMVGIIQDITTEKEYEEKLKASEKKYRLLIDNMQDGLFILQDFNLVFFNEAMANMLGYSKKELGSLGLDKLIAPKYLDFVKQNHNDRMNNKKVDSSYKIDLVHKNGDIIHVILNVGLIDYKGNKASHGTVKNITDLVRSQAILQKSETNLRDANATKDKFFSIIAHDLKNPFNAIMGFSNLLYEDFDDFNDDEKKKFIKNIWDAAESTFKLLENLLQWSRAQTGKIQYQPEYVDIKLVAMDNIAVLKPHADGKGIELYNDIYKESTVFADPNQLNTIIRNLISNAVKFTNKGGEIRISARDLGNVTEVCVSDTGLGIPESMIDHLFTIDKQFKREGTAKEKGSGLGLILCKEFIEKNGGRIWVESEEGKGSRFYFTVPKSKP